MELKDYIYTIGALLFVLALIGVLAVVARRLGFGHHMVGSLGVRRRLSIIETLQVDAKHRLVLLKRDAVEHLVLVGATSQAVIETGIPASPTVSSETLQESKGETSPAPTSKEEDAP